MPGYAQPRWVVLFHSLPPGGHRADHWDLMIEREGAFWTWALPFNPFGGGSGSAERLSDHSLEWFDREGPVGGGRGTAKRVGRGAVVHFLLTARNPGGILDPGSRPAASGASTGIPDDPGQPVSLLVPGIRIEAILDLQPDENSCSLPSRLALEFDLKPGGSDRIGESHWVARFRIA